MKWRKEEFVVNDDPGLLDIDFISESLQASQWAKHRKLEVIEKSIANSLCFGIYLKGLQVGFARVVTDKSTFSWICDIIVAPAYRGKGLRRWMLKCISYHPDVEQTTQVIRTNDGRGRIEKIGYKKCDMMAKSPREKPKATHKIGIHGESMDENKGKKKKE